MAASLALAVVLEASDRHLRRASSAVSRGIFVKNLSVSFCSAVFVFVHLGFGLQQG